MDERYDVIGRGYARHRRADPRIAAMVMDALGTLRSAVSSFATRDPRTLEAGLAQLEADLATGAWRSRNAMLLDREALDLGYRLVVADVV